MSASGSQSVAQPFSKTFCTGTRADLVEPLLGGEGCAGEITTDGGASQPLVSHHLAILRETGFVTKRSVGTRSYSSIDWGRCHAAATVRRTRCR